MNQSPATKGESLWLITEWRACASHTDKRAGRMAEPASEEADTTAENMAAREEEDKEGEGFCGVEGSANLCEACIGHPSYSLSAHYLVIKRGAVLKEGGINQLSQVNVLQPHYEPWVAL